MHYFNENQIIRNKFMAYDGYSHPKEYYQNISWEYNDLLELIRKNVTENDLIYNPLSKLKSCPRIHVSSLPQ